jgi:hypothetical protein
MPSNITKVTLQTTPLLFGNYGGLQLAKLRGEHTLYGNPDAVRVDCTAAAVGPNGLASVNFAAGGGDTIYLSYFTNQISSVRLTDPPPAGVSLFTTDNLSGCKFFVDQVAGSNDVIVYHANTRALSPPSNHGAVDPTLETPAATLELNRLHTAAAGDWALAPHNLALAAGGSVDKPHYQLGARAKVQHKAAMGRRRVPQANEPVDPQRLDRPEYAGGTVIFGFYTTRWKFYYQSWGAVDYRRPALSPKGWFGNRNERAVNMRLVGYGRIYPLPATDNVIL